MKKKTKKDALKEMLQEIQKPKPAEPKPVIVESKPLSTAPHFEMWKKIQFKEHDKVHDAYVYHVEGNQYYVSQNKGFDTFCHAQTWVINKNQII